MAPGGHSEAGDLPLITIMGEEGTLMMTTVRMIILMMLKRYEKLFLKKKT